MCEEMVLFIWTLGWLKEGGLISEAEINRTMEALQKKILKCNHNNLCIDDIEFLSDHLERQVIDDEKNYSLHKSA